DADHIAGIAAGGQSMGRESHFPRRAWEDHGDEDERPDRAARPCNQGRPCARQDSASCSGAAAVSSAACSCAASLSGSPPWVTAARTTCNTATTASAGETISQSGGGAMSETLILSLICIPETSTSMCVGSLS